MGSTVYKIDFKILEYNLIQLNLVTFLEVKILQ